MEDDGRQHELNEIEDACVSIKWSGEFERRLPPMVEIVLKLAANEPIKDVLAIQIGARVAPLKDGLRIVFSKNIGHRLDFPSDLWIQAERAQWSARLRMLKAGETRPRVRYSTMKRAESRSRFTRYLPR